MLKPGVIPTLRLVLPVDLVPRALGNLSFHNFRSLSGNFPQKGEGPEISYGWGSSRRKALLTKATLQKERGDKLNDSMPWKWLFIGGHLIIVLHRVCSPDPNTSCRFSGSAVSGSDNPSRMNQRSSAERKTRSWSYLCLPRPSSLRGLRAADNSRARFISTLAWAAAATASAVSTSTISASAVPATPSTALVAAFLAIVLHELFVLAFTKSPTSPVFAFALLVCASWRFK